MDPMVAWIFGLMMGCAVTLLIQAYGRRKVKKAMAEIRKDAMAKLQDDRDTRDRTETLEIARRLAVLEEIVTDRPAALAEQIEGLR